MVLEVHITSPEVKINALTNGLGDGDLFSSLAKKKVETFDELLRRAEKYITLQEVRKAKKIESKSSTDEKKKPSEVKQSSPELTRTRSRSRRKYYRGPIRPKSERFCRFHNEYRHDTNNYFLLRDEIERMIQAANVGGIKGIHHDALVITTNIAGKIKGGQYQSKRCYVDSVKIADDVISKDLGRVKDDDLGLKKPKIAEDEE
ncbi:hypothetical protein ACS0TY_033791 [Phlomoides rotata]